MGRDSTFTVSLAALAAGVLLAGCGGSSSTHAVTSTSATTSTAPASGPRDQFGTVWLCRPGERPNPCLGSLTTTAVAASGATNVERAVPAAAPPVDCFYVYPTVSGQPTVNANLTAGFTEEEVATAQAARFSQTCRVYAPVYRQITLAALEHPARITRADALLAYRSVLSAFRDYLAHYNHGRGIVFIGHSQGATILTRLLEQEVDPQPALRRRLVSALLLGGNVTVRKNRTTGGDFAHIPACTSSRQAGCVVAYSSFTSRPPKNSQFGRTSSDAGVGLLAPRRLPPNLQIMCVNPAAPGGGEGTLEPYIPTAVLAFNGTPLAATTPWVAFSGGYTARCETSGNASWLQIAHTAGSSRPAAAADAVPTADPRPPHPRPQHRTRQPRQARDRPGSELPKPVRHLVWEFRGETELPRDDLSGGEVRPRFLRRQVMEEQDRHGQHHDQSEDQVNVFPRVHLAR